MFFSIESYFTLYIKRILFLWI